MKRFVSISMIVSVAVLLLTVSGCKEKKAQEYNGVFTFIRGAVSVNGNAAKVGSKVSAAETINVGEKSGAVLQFANHAQLTLGAGTTVSVTQLMAGNDGKPAINLNQESGSSFSKVLAKGADYKMSTPTLVAGVRGTSFSVSIDPKNKSRVAVKLLEGKVEATPVSAAAKSEKAAPVILEAGQKITADEKSVKPVEKITAKETETLQKLDKIAMVQSDDISEALTSSSVPAIEMETDIEEIMTKPEESVLIPETEAPAAPKVVPLTIEQLRSKYGRLSKVTTKDGKTYIGAFSQKGGAMQVITTTGTVSIPSNNVQNVSTY